MFSSTAIKMKRSNKGNEHKNPKRKRREFNVDEFVSEAPRFDFGPLIEADEDLEKHVKLLDGNRTIDFTSRVATLLLSKAIMKHHFNLQLYLPQGHLVPTIPNRIQYLKWAAGLLPDELHSESITVLDIGTGPSCIYPLLGTKLFPSWKFVATDVDEEAIRSARQNCAENNIDSVLIIKTKSNEKFFNSHVQDAKPALTVCNPPFHSKRSENLAPAGTDSQLITNGGEYAFVCKLARESVCQPSVLWFTSLVGCKEDLPKIVSFLRSPSVNAVRVRSAQLCPGGRTIRWAVAWSFGQIQSIVKLHESEQSKWRRQILIIPGREYSNQLSIADIQGVLASLFIDKGWSDESHNASNEAKATFCGPEGTGFENSELEVWVHRGADECSFSVLLKIIQSGGMHSSKFTELCCSFIRSILAFLDS